MRFNLAATAQPRMLEHLERVLAGKPFRTP
jgi:hypothetical protein